MVDLVETGFSIFGGISENLYRKIDKYEKDKKSDKINVQEWERLKNDKENIKNYLFGLIEKDILSSSEEFEKRLSKFNFEPSIKIIFEELDNKKCLAYENKSKTEYGEEINQKKKELEKIIEERTSLFLTGNNYSDIYLVNKQIIKIIIHQLFKVRNIDKQLHLKIKDLFEDYIKFIRKEFGEYYENNLGSEKDLIRKYKEKNKKKMNEMNKEEINIEEEKFQFISNDFLSNEKKKDKNSEIIQETFINKVLNFYRIEVIKKASLFLDNKIIQHLSLLLIQSLN